MKRAFIGLSLVTIASAAAIGCSAASPEPVAQTDQEIIGGVDAPGASMDAVGSLVIAIHLPPPPPPPPDGGPTPDVDGGPPNPGADGGAPPPAPVPASRPVPFGTHFPKTVGEPFTLAGDPNTIYYPFCTGTLIGPKTVLTAKHCVIDGTGGYEMGFAIGYDARQPKKVVPIVRTAWDNTVTGGTMELGADVAVGFLGEAVTGVTPRRTGKVEDAQIGKTFVNVGYGVQDNLGTAGTRKAGGVKLTHLEGNPFKVAFPTFEAMLLELGAVGQPPEVIEMLRNYYENSALIPGYEAIFGGTPGDAQSCYGDSGGPVIAKNGKIVAVTSWGFGSRRLVCDYGGIYATFGPKAEELIDTALKCDKINLTQGKCRGKVAQRCTGPLEGDLRVVETDCSILGQKCGTNEAGQVACVDR